MDKRWEQMTNILLGGANQPRRHAVGVEGDKLVYQLCVDEGNGKRQRDWTYSLVAVERGVVGSARAPPPTASCSSATEPVQRTLDFRLAMLPAWPCATISCVMVSSASDLEVKHKNLSGLVAEWDSKRARNKEKKDIRMGESTKPRTDEKRNVGYGEGKRWFWRFCFCFCSRTISEQDTWRIKSSLTPPNPSLLNSVTSLAFKLLVFTARFLEARLS